MSWRERNSHYSNHRYHSSSQPFNQHRRQYCQEKAPRPYRQPNVQRVPDRWLNYDPLGREIKDARFIAFKTPLKSAFFRENDPTRFEVEHVVSSTTDLGHSLGLVVDLTNTNRYYDSRLWSSYGVEYVKLRCPGHEIDKEEGLVHQFLRIVCDFFAERSNDGKIIGVHCTHGLNRTGYLICRYLIDELGWPATKAIQEFETSRGHRIERDAYISSLYYAEELRQANLDDTQDSANKDSEEQE